MKLNHIISTILSSIITVTLLTACEKSESVPEETTVSETSTLETTAKYSDEELELIAQDMPEIVFVLAYHNDNENIFGYYITNTGNIKMFDFREITPDEIYEIPNVYDRLKEATCSELVISSPIVFDEDLLEENELYIFPHQTIMDYYKKLLLMNGNAQYVDRGYALNGGYGHYKFYGIKTDGENKEFILLFGDGEDYEYIHEDKNALSMYMDIKEKVVDLRYITEANNIEWCFLRLT